MRLYGYINSVKSQSRAVLEIWGNRTEVSDRNEDEDGSGHDLVPLLKVGQIDQLILIPARTFSRKVRVYSDFQTKVADDKAC